MVIYVILSVLQSSHNVYSLSSCQTHIKIPDSCNFISHWINQMIAYYLTTLGWGGKYYFVCSVPLREQFDIWTRLARKREVVINSSGKLWYSHWNKLKIKWMIRIVQVETRRIGLLGTVSYVVILSRRDKITLFNNDKNLILFNMLARSLLCLSIISSASSSSFVVRNGSQLMLDGEEFSFSGVNIYWLGQDENNPNTPLGESPYYSHPSMFR